jgi:hypothetical protein
MLKRNYSLKAVAVALLLSLTLPLIGCSKEKAEAIKTGAEQFRVQASSALDAIRELNKQDALVIFTTNDQEVKNIANEFNERTDVSRFINDKLAFKQRLETPNSDLDQNLSSMQEAYELFASMFRSLPRGNFLAGKEVKKSKIFAIKLTTQMVNLAKMLGAAPFRFSARRQDLMHQFQAANEVADAAAKKQAVVMAAQQLVKLRDDEAKANIDAITQCLKAAEAGKLITNLIDQYDKLSVGDILDLTKNSLSIINDVTGGTHDVQAAISRYDAFVKNKIETDPLWKDVLNTDVKSLESLVKNSSK